ncbi:MAG TPA: FliM/FliN family flagellar motor switch protein [Planctomycetota bacterium]|nr:FliM/FliN family flagellar motor switch protein [Planctomycetota bacterium]
MSPEEAQAILDIARRGSGARADAPSRVEARDFEKPLRLSRGELESVRARIAASLEGVALELSQALRGDCTLELVELAEVNAERVTKGLIDPAQSPAPPAIVRFEIARQPGWLVWDAASAVAAVESALGAGPPAAEPAARALSAVERASLRRMLAGAIARLASALGLSAASLTVPESVEVAGDWRDGGASADPQRLALHLALEAPAGASVLKLYLPGFQPAAPRSARELANAVPAHLHGVSLELAARLGSSDVSLREMLALEVGDVIPLSTPVGEVLRVYVEGEPCAVARLGRKDGNLAIRIAGSHQDEEER